MTEEKERIWEEATMKSYAENPMGTNWDRISIAMDLYAESELKKLTRADNVLSLRDCKEQWASNYGKTWEDVQLDFEYGLGLSKMFDFEEVMDMVAELYHNQ